jgi:hypothetical protein
MTDPAAPQQPQSPPVLGLAEALMVSEDEQSELDKIIEMILDPANIAHNTELSRNEITAFSVLSTLSSKHNLPVLKEFLKQNLILRVSKGRKGRSELIKILNRQMAAQEQMASQEARRGWFGRRR